MPLRTAVDGGALLVASLLTAGTTTGDAAANPAVVFEQTAAQQDVLEPTGPAVVEVAQSSRRSRWYGLAGIGFVYRWGFDHSMLGAALDGELGAQNQRIAGGLRLHIEAGRMLAGLPFQVVTFGPMMWLRVQERVRLGFGIDGGALLLSRRTLPGRSMWTVMLGGHVDGSVDLWRIGATSALHLTTSVGVSALTVAPGPVSVSTSLALGYRP
jgi:hypothetical protein